MLGSSIVYTKNTKHWNTEHVSAAYQRIRGGTEQGNALEGEENGRKYCSGIVMTRLNRKWEPRAGWFSWRQTPTRASHMGCWLLQSGTTTAGEVSSISYKSIILPWREAAALLSSWLSWSKKARAVWLSQCCYIISQLVGSFLLHWEPKGFWITASSEFQARYWPSEHHHLTVAAEP